MVETLSRSTPKARKAHRCSYCCEPIQKGETYRRSKNKCDGYLYTWKSHMHCAAIAEAIWDFADPYEGLDECTFQECTRQIMDELYCPAKCENWDEDDGCDKFDWDKCLRRFADYLKTHELVQVSDKSGIRMWQLVEKKPKGGQDGEQ